MIKCPLIEQRGEERRGEERRGAQRASRVEWSGVEWEMKGKPYSRLYGLAYGVYLVREAAAACECRSDHRAVDTE